MVMLAATGLFVNQCHLCQQNGTSAHLSVDTMCTVCGGFLCRKLVLQG
jgi:hypothetical protein